MFSVALIFLFGLIIGSFINAVLWRLREQEKIALARSMCPACRHVLGFLDLIPLISFFLLRGKCRYCEKPISWSYVLIEAATGILFVLAYLAAGGAAVFETFSAMALFLRNLVFISVLIVIFFYDFRWYLILDKVTLPSIVVAYIANGFLLSKSLSCVSWQQCLVQVPWTNLLIGAAIGGGFFLLQYVVSSGRWIGGGDIRLGALMGVMLGYPFIGLALFLAYVVGAVFVLCLLILGKKKFGSQIPFGTFLSAATIATLLYGETIFFSVKNYFLL
ncbi:MAG: prepilin peptidase [bacterium]|nr:prepilin peptidase [bacterium]